MIFVYTFFCGSRHPTQGSLGFCLQRQSYIAITCFRHWHQAWPCCSTLLLFAGTFDLLVYTDAASDVPQEWEDSDPRFIQNAADVKLRSFTTKVSLDFPFESMLLGAVMTSNSCCAMACSALIRLLLISLVASVSPDKSPQAQANGQWFHT